MKLRWGTAIVLSFALFIAFIGSMVIQIFNTPELQHELVTSNYYQKEQSLNQHIQAKKNAQSWQKEFTHKIDKEFVSFGPLPNGYLITLNGYCPSDASKDFSISTILETKLSYVKLPLKVFGSQHWEVQLHWRQKDSIFSINYPIVF